MTTKVLLANATKNWSTAEIARTITEVLREEGLDSEMRLVSDVGEPQAYDALVLGSGPLDPSASEGKGGDFRDFKPISTRARRVAAELRGDVAAGTRGS
ncbi:hypothetical protein OG453_44995 [Streptomyces sp. NBC_01381]|uniref:hypothetical protein n=1 Tax=Streptomyces sp. NBC_01381 TaxID=2903845 RepID=UPI0022552C3C|nr:hypothetical protein [Streptomyces sp. NBC_01381]MCX4673716.1 hypothetical protein [Streptomyces sp. NBC_01381]